MLVLFPKQNFYDRVAVSAIVEIYEAVKRKCLNNLIAYLDESISRLVHADEITDIGGLAPRFPNMEGLIVEDMPGPLSQSANFLFN